MAASHALAIARSAALGRVVAVADPCETARRAMLNVAPPAKAFQTVEQLLAESSVDVVHVCTPPATHYAVAMRVLEAGVRIYVEKPSRRRRERLPRYLTARRNKGFASVLGINYLNDRPIRVALRLLPSLGTLAHIESYSSFRAVRRNLGARTAPP